MPAGRPVIPAALKREVLMESGYRCAISTCRNETVDLAHITPWAKVKQHTFDNLIALCPNCHTMFDNGKIPEAAIRRYKANLAVVNGRYGDLERRVIEALSSEPELVTFQLPGGLEILLKYLLEDRIIETYSYDPVSVNIMGVTSISYYDVTAKGRDFIQRWSDAKPL
ncbi:MAG TPA: HNH endonuclease signature motif containing protein, partial [Bryobacteraceae bacterium]